MRVDKIGTGLGSRLGGRRDGNLYDVNIFVKAPAAPSLCAMALEGAVADPRQWMRDVHRAAVQAYRPVLDALSAEAGSPHTTSASGVVFPRVLRMEPFWINDAIGSEVSYDVLERIVERDDVEHVELTRYSPLADLLDDRPRRLDRAPRRSTPPGSTFRAAFADVVDTPAAPTWNVMRVNAPLLWQLGLTGSGVLVAVIDNGINYEHPDLAPQMWDGTPQFPHHGYDFASGDDDPNAEDGHGTSCAGIIAGTGASGLATGVAPGCRVMALRVGGAERTFWRALQFALERGVHVISMSMTWKPQTHPNYPGWRRACEKLLAAGVLHVNSTGNDGHNLTGLPLPFNIGAPGNCPPPWIHPAQVPGGGVSAVISCGATDDADRLVASSGRGPAAWETPPFVDYVFAGGAGPGLIKPDICAPGPGVTSCNWRYPHDASAKPYGSFEGTSSATPHVAGCLALLAEACLRSTMPIVPARMQEALEMTAVRIAGQSAAKENNFGAGRVDVFAAYTYGVERGWWE